MWVNSQEACERLGIRSQTLYAYVSRGRLTPRREGGRSLFDTRELDQLAARSRRSARTGRLEVLIDTELTLLDRAGRLFYRGVEVTEIATTWSYERTAEWLWSSHDGEPAAWAADPAWATLARRVEGERPSQRLRAATAAIANAADREVGPVDVIGRALVPSLVEALPVLRTRPPGRIAGIDRDDPIAARLWPRLTTMAPTADRLRLLNAAMVLLADHEMAVSALAARVAASAWAPPVDAVLAGFAAHGGGLHGGITTLVQRALREGSSQVRGFGHTVYEGDDPRAQVLLALLADVVPANRWRPLARAAAAGEHPNVDFAVGAMAVAFDMVDGAGEAVFALARVAGWLAHAAEEYEHPFRFRARASYVGPPPR